MSYLNHKSIEKWKIIRRKMAMASMLKKKKLRVGGIMPTQINNSDSSMLLWVRALMFLLGEMAMKVRAVAVVRKILTKSSLMMVI